MKDILINSKYRVERKIGGGGFGVVYSGTDTESGEKIAIKLEYIREDYPTLEHESTVCKSLAGGVGIPSMRWYGQECDFNVMISDLLGPSLEDLFNYCDRKFSLKTVLQLADQLIRRVEYLHTKSFVHRDIKPENFLMGTGKLGNIVHLIDFGLAKEYQDPETHVHRAYSNKHKLGGTTCYASINNHLGIAQSRRDDLESLGYIMIYFYRGSLPWQGLKASTEDERNELIKEMKMNTLIEDLCQGLPNTFTSYFKHVRGLKYDDRPNYSYLRKLFCNLFLREGYHYDYVFDWTIKKFSTMYGDPDDQPAQTRISKKGKTGPHDLREVPLIIRPRSSLGRPTGQRASKRLKARGLRQAKNHK